MLMQADIAKTPAALRALQAMKQEALLQASLQHPNVLGLVGAVLDQGAFAGFLMPFCQGGSLETALRCRPPHSSACYRTAALMVMRCAPDWQAAPSSTPRNMESSPVLPVITPFLRKMRLERMQICARPSPPVEVTVPVLVFRMTGANRCCSLQSQAMQPLIHHTAALQCSMTAGPTGSDTHLPQINDQDLVLDAVAWP